MVRRILISLGVGVGAGACFIALGALATKTRRASGVDMGDYWRIVLIGLIAGIIATTVAFVLTQPRIPPVLQAGAVAAGLVLLLAIEIPLLGLAHVHGGRYACEHQGMPPDTAWDNTTGHSDVAMHWSWSPFGFTCEVTTEDGSRRAWHLNWGDTFGAKGWQEGLPSSSDYP